MIPTRVADTCMSSARPATGKSTLLLNLIAQDLAAGQGLAVLDPHGDLAETVLLHVPRNRGNVIMPRQRARHVGRLNRR